MIPLCARQKISIERDGITWIFKPKIGQLEYDISEQLKKFDGMEPTERMTVFADIIDRVLVGWDDPQKRMPVFPEDGKPSALFGYSENVEIFTMWGEANTLTDMEKKS